ncbi:MAG: hypothetical protein ACYTG6_07105 [Planctomycetota bacterium]|jgi:hypothetical protein
MSIRPEYRWWILTLAVVVILFGISALALDRPNVIWSGAEPQCPHCRNAVPAYSQRCPTCREEFDWTVAHPDDSPLSSWSLSLLETEYLRERVNALGAEVAVARIAEALGLTKEDAADYLEQVGRGRCGWCGGTGRHLAALASENDRCPACLGKGQCVGCGGDRRIRVGDPVAAQAYARYRAELEDILGPDGTRRPILPAAAQRDEARRLAEDFLLRHAGTEEAGRILFWLEWTVPSEAPWRPERCAPTIVVAARRRLDALLGAVGSE